MAKYAWTWDIKPECVEDYVRMHLDPWPGVLRAHERAGFKNYSIFQNGCQFFYEFEYDGGDPGEAFAKAAADAECARWNAITAKLIDKRPEDGMQYLREVFFLK